MKIIMEPNDSAELEIILRGNITGPEAASVLQLLQKKTSDKVILYKEEEQHIVAAAEIVYLEACGNGVLAHTAGETYEARLKLYEARTLLSAFSFVQINKSTIVNIDHVCSIQAEFSGNYRLKLRSRSERLTISRKYFKDFKEQI